MTERPRFVMALLEYNSGTGLRSLYSMIKVSLFYHQTVMSFENGKLVQKQTWDGKETTIEREITDGKLIAVRKHFFFLQEGVFIIIINAIDFFFAYTLFDSACVAV